MAEVWKCDLPPNQAYILLAMADQAWDDGSHCFPSVNYLAWKCGYTRRQIQNILRELRAKGVLLVVAFEHGGRSSTGAGRATEYLIRLTDVARKPDYRSGLGALAKGENISPLTVKSATSKGEICDVEGCNLQHEGCNLRHERVNPISPQPLLTIIEPLEETSVNHDTSESFEKKFWNDVLALLQLQVTRPTFETWLRNTRCLGLTHEVATILVPNTYTMEMLNQRMYSLIIHAAQQVRPDVSEIVFEVAQFIDQE